MQKEESKSEIAIYKEIWETAHAINGDDVVRALKTDIRVGLTKEEAERRAQMVGPNCLPKKPPRSMWLAIIDQFKDALVLILVGAALISVVISIVGGEAEEEGIGAFVEPFVIVVILAANAGIGLWQEMNAEKALEALMQLQAEETQVLRDGKFSKISVTELVPGDICRLNGGDKVPADIRCLEAMGLKATQGMLTGESTQISKGTEKIEAKPNAINQDKTNMLFSATGVTAGQCLGVVVGTGMNSEIGKIQELIQQAADAKRKTPLKENLEKFGKMLSYIVGLICLVSWVINIPKFSDPGHGTWFRAAMYYFKISVSLAVAAIPEGLPAVITTCLALATRRMAKINAIIRHLSSVETLGCTTIICSDKTGTLTLNDMTAVEFTYFRSPEEPVTFEVELPLNGEVKGMNRELFQDVYALMYDMTCVAAVCNDAKLRKDPNDPERLKPLGMATEVALKVLTYKLAQYDLQAAKKDDSLEWYANSYVDDNPLIAKFPFTSARKCMSMMVKRGERKMLLLKGAAEVVLGTRSASIQLADGKIVPLTPEIKAQVAGKLLSSTRKGLRCLGCAIRTDFGQYNDKDEDFFKAISTTEERYGELEKDCIFLGYIGIKDPPRVEVKPAIAKCREAGISVVMITGDNKDTAAAIAREIELVDSADKESQYALEGVEFDRLVPMNERGKEDDGYKTALLKAQLDKLREGVCVFSRVAPCHKIQLVKLFQDHLHQVVAMTGDGVNDAPALQQADIGIAMGITGSDVAKETSKMVLADDNFATIVKAVEEGRAIYSNIKSFIRYLISSNIGEVVAIFLGSLLGLPEVLTAVQLLWMNLVTDGLPAIALGFNPPDVGLMQQPPRKKDEPIISLIALGRYMIIGIYVGAATVVAYIHAHVSMETGDSRKHVTLAMLRNWSKCPTWSQDEIDACTINKPCDMFTTGDIRATTLSLTVLVLLEMVGSMNAVSELQSIFVMPPWKNRGLCLAIFSSVALHCLIMYIPFLNTIFEIAPLSRTEWMWAVIYALPLFAIDEILKFIGRCYLPVPAKLKSKLKCD